METSAVMKLSQEIIDTNDKLQSFVEKAKFVTIPLFPETVQFTDTALKYGAAIVKVDTELGKYGSNRDIYKNESGSYCLHLSKLNEIAQQSGIIITDSRILERKTDEKGRVVFVSHQVKGKLKSVDGSIKEDVATGKYDYYRDTEKYSSPKQISGRRAHAEALAESNAKTRLFNKLVAKLPSSFELDELKKPFLIPYVLEDKDEILKSLPIEDQIAIKRDLARKRLGLMDSIYGEPKQLAEIENVKIDVIDDEPKEIINKTNGNSIEENKIIANEFRNASEKERSEKILSLIQKKNYKHPKGVIITPDLIKKANIDRQIELIEELLNMPEAESEESL